MISIPGYEVTRELGRGGMGLVLLAKDRNGEEVAIKVLQNLAKESLLQRFQREERLQALLSGKDGFVPLLASGDTEEGPYLVMPYLRGGTLRDRLQKGMFELDDAVSLVHSLALALGKAHDAGIVHRDIKPENILFDEKGKPFVSDLGLAKHFRRDLPGGSKSINVTKTGQSLGTTGYMAIEQMRDAQNAAPPADVFALGAILYECLVGRCPPYINRKPLLEARPELPAWVSQVVERALARDPKERFADGTAFARALSQAETRVAVSALAVTQASEPATVAGPLPDTQTRERFLDEVPGAAAAAEKPAELAAAPSAAPGLVSSVPDSLPDATPVPAPVRANTEAPTRAATRPDTRTPVPLAAAAPVAPPRSWTWLWVVLLVVGGVVVGVVADRLLR